MSYPLCRAWESAVDNRTGLGTASGRPPTARAGGAGAVPSARTPAVENSRGPRGGAHPGFSRLPAGEYAGVPVSAYGDLVRTRGGRTVLVSAHPWAGEHEFDEGHLGDAAVLLPGLLVS